MRLRCTNCEAAFDGEPSERCPKCLRRTSVVHAAAPEARPRTGALAPWPDGNACPLCLANDVSEAAFVIEIPSGASGAEPGAAPAATKPGAATVRCRCCDPCRARVVGLRRLRGVLLPFAMLVMLAWPVLAVSELPMRLVRVGKVEAVALVTLLCVVVATVPLVVLDRASRSVRKNLEASWLLRQLLARVRAQAGAGPERPDEWRVLAEARSAVVVVEATELLRTG